MRVEQLIEQLKEMGLDRFQRSRVVETYREEGEAAALIQAKDISAKEAKQVAAAKQSANQLLGISL